MAEEHSKVRILLADEQPLFRDAVKLVLESQPDMKVVAEAQDGLQAVSAAEQNLPDVALLGASLPNCDGIRATYLIRERIPSCRVVILTEEEDEDTLLAAVEAGANGYLTKECPLAELIATTHTVHRGETVVPSRMLGGLLGRLILRRREKEHALRRAARLSRREREVLALLAEGGDNGSIAQALVISPETARTHIQNVLAKLGVHSRLEAAAFVVQNQILDDLIGADL